MPEKEVPIELLLRGEGLAEMSAQQLDSLVLRLGKQGIDVVSADGLVDQDEATIEFFGRTPEAVAEDLIGKQLFIGSKHAEITAVLPQTAKENSKWLDKPLFGPYPVDVYVSPYRGSHLLFMRTGALNSCVRIDGVETSRNSYPRPGQVAKYFGANSERTGNVILVGDDSVVVDWS